MRILTLSHVTNTFHFISSMFFLLCFAEKWDVDTKKVPHHRDAAPSKYQNNVSNTNYYYYEFTNQVIIPNQDSE